MTWPFAVAILAVVIAIAYLALDARKPTHGMDLWLLMWNDGPMGIVTSEADARAYVEKHACPEEGQYVRMLPMRLNHIHPAPYYQKRRSYS